MAKSIKVLLLGSGELGKEMVIALQRLGQTDIPLDTYPGAHATQVADGFEVITMQDRATHEDIHLLCTLEIETI